jgi:hypothetical protein
MIKLCHPFWSIFAGVIIDSWPAPSKPSCHINGLIRRIGGSAACGDRWNGPRGPLFITAVGRTKIPCSGAHLWWRREGKILEKNLNRKILGSCWGSITMQNAAIFAQKIAVRATFKSLDHPRFIRVKETNFAENPAESILPPGHCHCSFPLSCPAWLTGSVLWDPLKSQENRTILKRRCKRQTEVREKNRGISNWRS